VLLSIPCSRSAIADGIHTLLSQIGHSGTTLAKIYPDPGDEVTGPNLCVPSGFLLRAELDCLNGLSAVIASKNQLTDAFVLPNPMF